MLEREKNSKLCITQLLNLCKDMQITKICVTICNA